MDLDSPYDRDRAFDAAVTRMRPHSEKIEDARACATKLAKLFTTPEQQRRVLDLITEFIESDGQVSSSETKFLSVIKGAFHM
jgi:hypothetical protein